MIGIGSVKGIEKDEIMQKYKNIGKEKTIDIRTKQNEAFLNRTGALLYKNMKLNPVMLSDKVSVRIGVKLLNAGWMKRNEQEIKLVKSKISNNTHGLINHL